MDVDMKISEGLNLDRVVGSSVSHSHHTCMCVHCMPQAINSLLSSCQDCQVVDQSASLDMADPTWVLQRKRKPMSSYALRCQHTCLS